MSMKGKKNPRVLYSKETLKEAIAAIQAGMPINTASNKYQIPRSTLHNKKTAKYADKRPGPDTVLTTAEENTLVQWVFNCSKQGMPVSKQHLLNSVALLVKTLNRENPFANGRPGRHWYQSFLRRHENVVDKINENSTFARAPALEPEIRKWFCSLRCYLEEKKLIHISPSRIFTTETCVLLSPDGGDEKENLCVQVAGSANGQLAPPMILFTYQRIPGKIYEGLPQGWLCSKSENGYMTPESFYEYVTKCFHTWLVENKIEFPVLLFLDGRVPYLTLSLSDFCLRNKIELIGLHPNTSHVLQPLNVTMFTTFKMAWRQALVDYRMESKAVNLLKENVAPLLKSVLDVLRVDEMLITGFETSGLYPLSENAVNYEKVPKKVIEKAKTERIEFTPFMANEFFEATVEDSSAGDGISSEALRYLEQCIDSDTLQNFKSTNEYDDWTGRIEDMNLFYVWRKIKTEANHLNFQQDAVDIDYEPPEVAMAESDIHSIKNEIKSDHMEFIIEDPLKLCVTEMEET